MTEPCGTTGTPAQKIMSCHCSFISMHILENHVKATNFVKYDAHNNEVNNIWTND